MKSRNIIVMLDIAHKESAIALCHEAELQVREGDILHLAYVMPYGYFNYIEPFVSEENIRLAADRARTEIEAISRQSLSSVKAKNHVLRGGVGEQAMLLMKQLGCDLLMFNAHRPGVKAHSLGSYASQMVRHANCSVHVHRQPLLESN